MKTKRKPGDKIGGGRHYIGRPTKANLRKAVRAKLTKGARVLDLKYEDGWLYTKLWSKTTRAQRSGRAPTRIHHAATKATHGTPLANSFATAPATTTNNAPPRRLTMTEIILMQYRNSIALHLAPTPPRSTDQVGDWRKRSAKMHRLAADLIEGIDSYRAPYVMEDERIVIELSGSETMDELISTLLNVLENSCMVYPGIVDSRGLVIIDPDFTDGMDACNGCGCTYDERPTLGCTDENGCGHTA